MIINEEAMYLRVTASVLLLVLIVKADTLNTEDQNSEDLCYLCSCSADGSNVDCSRRGLTDVPNGGGERVISLNISNNEISTFPPNLRRFTKLHTLDISKNKLMELPENALQNLTVLEFLNLSRNNFENWIDLNPNDILQPATSLKILDLSYNNFKTMGNLANHELLISASLETLILDHCEITSIYGRSPLNGLINLSVLKLNSNPLSRLNNLISTTLKSLYLSNCELTTINSNALTFLPSLVYLKLSHNYRLELMSTSSTIYSESLRYIDISFCNILQPNIQGFPNLRKATVSHNAIRYLESKEFLNNTKLEHLDLSYNFIGSIKHDTFRGLNMLKYLDLSWNDLGEIPENSLLKMPSLTQINLSRNYFTKFGHPKSTSLTKLDMSYSEINTIGKDSFEGLESIQDINLSHNLLPYIPESISSNTLRYLNLNYNRISFINNYTFFMLPKLTGLGVVGNRFTNIWSRQYFQMNPFLERLDLSDNMWRCDCSDKNMLEFFEFVTLEPNKKEESFNLICYSPSNVIGQTWLEACYFTWNPSTQVSSPDTLIWFIVAMITGLAVCLLLVNIIRASMKRRLAAIQAERERQIEAARDRLRQLRMRAEQEALINNPDPRDLIAPPSYDEALSMPKLNVSCQSLCDAVTGKRKKRKGRRKTKSSGDLLDETERNGDLPVVEDSELTEFSNNNRRRRRQVNRYGSQEITELDRSPGARRRLMSEYHDLDPEYSVTIEVEAELERPHRTENRRGSISDNNEPRESNF